MCKENQDRVNTSFVLLQGKCLGPSPTLLWGQILASVAWREEDGAYSGTNISALFLCGQHPCTGENFFLWGHHCQQSCFYSRILKRKKVVNISWPSNFIWSLLFFSPIITILVCFFFLMFSHFLRNFIKPLYSIYCSQLWSILLKRSPLSWTPGVNIELST